MYLKVVLCMVVMSVCAYVAQSAPAGDCANTVFNVFTADDQNGKKRSPSSGTDDSDSPIPSVAFSVASRLADNGGSTYTTIKFDEVITNRQKAFNLATNVFTAPVAGIYSFSFTGRANGNNCNVYYNVNGERKILNIISPTSSVGSMSRVEELHAGDSVYFSLHSGHKLYACSPPCTTFSGFLIHRIPTQLARG